MFFKIFWTSRFDDNCATLTLTATALCSKILFEYGIKVMYDFRIANILQAQLRIQQKYTLSVRREERL